MSISWGFTGFLWVRTTNDMFHQFSLILKSVSDKKGCVELVSNKLWGFCFVCEAVTHDTDRVMCDCLTHSHSVLLMFQPARFIALTHLNACAVFACLSAWVFSWKQSVILKKHHCFGDFVRYTPAVALKATVAVPWCTKINSVIILS